ncbi:MAG: hypothetical protein JSR42_10980 [Proteobacteria bacterium]|nr:hypothetical protein [Pseudomonadota bacterium]MBS0552518.1 hypothetical protein [Pseudomonadota bacterium]
MNVELANAARDLRPGLKVLLTSAYAENSLAGDGHIPRDMQLINKPYRQKALAARLSHMLDAAAGPVRGTPIDHKAPQSTQ